MELIDISALNGGVDWRAVKRAGVSGVWLKATEGHTFDDKAFGANRHAANAAGLRVGAYHFARPDLNGAEAEADHFAAVVGSVGRRDLRPVLDLEQKTGLRPRDLEAWARAFNQRVLKTLGVLPAFYSYPFYIQRIGASRPIGNGLWLASYGANDGRRHKPLIPAPWRRTIAHQYTSNGRVSGVTGRVDRSYASRLSGVLAHPVVGLL